MGRVKDRHDAATGDELPWRGGNTMVGCGSARRHAEKWCINARRKARAGPLSDPWGKLRPLPTRHLGHMHMAARCNTLSKRQAIYLFHASVTTLTHLNTYAVYFLSSCLNLSIHIPYPTHGQLCNGRQMKCCLRGSTVPGHCRTGRP